MKVGLIYVRQSRHKESERTVSPEVQEQACRKLPAIRGCDQVEVYRDLDLSGKSVAKRPSFQRFLHPVETGTPVGEFSYTTLAAAHTMERKMTSAKIRSAYRYLNIQGIATGQPPYGYRRTDVGELEPVDEEAAVVRRIFAMYVSGTWSAQSIAGRLNDEGVPRQRARSRHGWLPDTIVDMLRNVAYIGRTYTESRVRRRGELIDARWPPIVDEAHAGACCWACSSRSCTSPTARSRSTLLSVSIAARSRH